MCFTFLVFHLGNVDVVVSHYSAGPIIVWQQCVGSIIEATANVAAADTDVSGDSHDETKYFNDDNWHDDDDAEMTDK